MLRSVPLPDAPAYDPVPPVTVNCCSACRAAPLTSLRHPGVCTERVIVPLPATVNVGADCHCSQDVCGPRTTRTPLSLTMPNPRTEPLLLIVQQSASLGEPCGQSIPPNAPFKIASGIWSVSAACVRLAPAGSAVASTAPSMRITTVFMETPPGRFDCMVDEPRRC